MIEIIKKYQKLGMEVKLSSPLTGETSNVKVSDDKIILNDTFTFDYSGHYILPDGSVSNQKMLDFSENYAKNPYKSILYKLKNFPIININGEEFLVIGINYSNTNLLSIDGVCKGIPDDIEFNIDLTHYDIDKFLKKFIKNCKYVRDFIESVRSEHKGTKITKYYITNSERTSPQFYIEFRYEGGYKIERLGSIFSFCG